jgi:hypothetical protein
MRYPDFRDFMYIWFPNKISPPLTVETVLRSFALTRNLRDPKEVFRPILDEGDEVALEQCLRMVEPWPL